MYADCPKICASQLQTEFAMSTTKAEYLALSTPLQNRIPLLRLVKEIKKNLQLPMDTIPKVICTVLEDNSGAMELAKVPTMHIHPKYHHVRKYVSNGLYQIVQVKPTEQLADIFKNLPHYLFLYF
jgi:hypothetical protein